MFALVMVRNMKINSGIKSTNSKMYKIQSVTLWVGIFSLVLSIALIIALFANNTFQTLLENPQKALTSTGLALVVIIGVLGCIGIIGLISWLILKIVNKKNNHNVSKTSNVKEVNARPIPKTYASAVNNRSNVYPTNVRNPLVSNVNRPNNISRNVNGSNVSSVYQSPRTFGQSPYSSAPRQTNQSIYSKSPNMVRPNSPSVNKPIGSQSNQVVGQQRTINRTSRV